MLVFLLYIVVCVIAWYAKSEKYDKTKRFLIISCIFLFLIMGLRDFSIGNDTYRYYLNYKQYQEMTWQEVKTFNLNYGFNYFTKFISMLFPETYTVYLLIVSGFCSIAIYKFLKKYSEDALISQIMLLALGFVFFFITGIKQTIAISFVLLAYIQLKEKKYISYILLGLLATLFHTTAIVFILALPMSTLKLKKSYFIVAPVLVVIAYLYRAPIYSLMRVLAQNSTDRYAAYGDSYNSSANITGLLIQCVIFGFSLFLLRGSFQKDEQLSSEFGIYVIGMMFQSMAGIMAEFFRLSMYFSIMGVILLPKALNRGFTKESTQLAKTIVFMVFVLYFVFFSSNNDTIIPYSSVIKLF